MAERDTRATQIVSMLRAALPDVEVVEDHRRTAALQPQRALVALFHDDWLELQRFGAPFDRLARRSAWSTLARNAHLNGSSRLAVTAAAGVPHLCADLALDDGDQLQGQLATLCENVGTHAKSLEEIGTQNLLDDSPLDPPKRVDSEALARLGRDAGWACSLPGQGELTVALEGRAGSHAARLTMGRGGVPQFEVSLLCADGCSAIAREAIALLLLGASAAIRSVKGLVRTRPDGDVVLLSTACSELTSAAGVNRALSALTVACERVGREAELLRHDDLARAYLSRWPSRPSAHDLDVQQHVRMKEWSCLQPQ